MVKIELHSPEREHKVLPISHLFFVSHLNKEYDFVQISKHSGKMTHLGINSEYAKSIG